MSFHWMSCATYEYTISQKNLRKIYTILEVFFSDIKEVNMWVGRVDKSIVCVYSIGNEMLVTISLMSAHVDRRYLQQHSGLPKVL